MRLVRLVSGLVLGVSAFAAVPAQSDVFHSAYTVSYAGLPIASSEFKTTVKGRGYNVQGSLRTAGLASIFAKTEGTTNIRGRLGTTGAEPARYAVRYVTGGTPKSTAITFRDGGVHKTINRPALRKRPDKVAVKPAHLKGVADPLSTGLLVAKSVGDVCNRTLTLYDGELVAKLHLSYAGQKPFITDGFKGNAVECTARFEPVAGYRKGHKSIEYLRQGTPISIGFAKLGDTDIYAPVTAKVKTQIGTVSVRATRLQHIAG